MDRVDDEDVQTKAIFLALEWGDILRMHGDKFSLAKRLSDGAGIARCGVRATKKT